VFDSTHENDPPADRVHRAILVLCRGDMGKLLVFAEAACGDWRDVLWRAEHPDPAPEEQVEQKEQVVRQILAYEEARHRDGLL
jgi:hypothetical protein